MQPISPVCDTMSLPEICFAKDQPEYLPLPAYRSLDGYVVTRWRLTWRERIRVMLRGDLWLSVMTFNKPLQPVKLLTEFPLSDVVDRQGT